MMLPGRLPRSSIVRIVPRIEVNVAERSAGLELEWFARPFQIARRQHLRVWVPPGIIGVRWCGKRDSLAPENYAENEQRQAG
jgi:hypothetical protein